MKSILKRRLNLSTGLTTIIAALVILLCNAGNCALLAQASKAHPFLLVSKSDFAALQKRADHAPWSEMKQKAIEFALDKNNAYSNYLDREPLVRASVLSDIMSASALAYILDPENRPFYVDKIKENLSYWDHLHKDRNFYSNGWLYHVPAGDAIYNSILALDIIHGDLSKKERNKIHGEINTAAEFLYAGTSSWGLNKYGARGLWALYQGDTSHPSIQEYMQQLYAYITEDGVFAPGPTYTHRITGTRHRDAKTTFMDIIHIQKIHDVYGDNRIKRGYEWIYGYSYTPTGRYFTFGDSKPELFSASGIAGYRASKFSAKAGALASGVIGDTPPPARLLHYVLMTDTLPNPAKPSSDIFSDGGAWFMENDITESSISGAMWNATILGDYHQHKEVNAINISAFGEDLIRNVGYNGWNNGALGFSWEYINETAISGNTVLIDHVNHQSRTGKGISEGFTSTLFDYASGDSGDALPNGKHQRNFVFIHPQDSKPGYFVLFDEIQGNSNTDSVSIALHPNSDDYSVISEHLDYQWKIGPNYSENDVFVNLFLGTTPNNVAIKKGVLLGGHSTESKNIIADFLYSTYAMDESKARNIVTVIFPSDEKHPKPAMVRIADKNSSGVRIDHGDEIRDYLIESSGSSLQEIAKDLSFQGRATAFRSDKSDLAFYFVRKGTAFKSQKAGFSSDKPVSIHLHGNYGMVVSGGTEITFETPGLKNVLLDGIEVAPLTVKDNSVKVFIPAGTFSIELKTE